MECCHQKNESNDGLIYHKRQTTPPIFLHYFKICLRNQGVKKVHLLLQLIAISADWVRKEPPQPQQSLRLNDAGQHNFGVFEPTEVEPCGSFQGNLSSADASHARGATVFALLLHILPAPTENGLGMLPAPPTRALGRKIQRQPSRARSGRRNVSGCHLTTIRPIVASVLSGLARAPARVLFRNGDRQALVTSRGLSGSAIAIARTAAL